MSQKTTINLILLVLVLVLSVLNWWPEEQAPELLPTLTERAPETVRKIKVEYPDGTLAAFERAGPESPWQMTAPWQMPANQTHLDALARVVEAPVFDSFPLTDERRAEFGLNKSMRLEVDDLSLTFGTTNPLNSHRYLLEGGRLVLMVDRFYHHLAGGPESLLSPALLPPDADIRGIHGPDLLLDKTESGWQLTPANEQLGMDAINAYVDEWRNAQGLAVRHFPEPELAQANPNWQLQLGPEQVLELVQLEHQGNEWLVRKDNGLGYQLSKGNTLLKGPVETSGQP